MGPFRSLPRPGLRSGLVPVRVAGPVLVALLATVAPVRAQEPPDTAPPPPDSVARDTLALPDSLAAAADSLPEDTIFYNLPAVPEPVPEGWARGIWIWDHEEILASGATTVLELVDEVPGMVPLRGGDHGTPLGLTAFGAAGGGLRVLRDGVEMIPLAGSVPDLQRVGLGGVDEVRLERHMGELVIHLRSKRYEDHRAWSLVEAGTGDLDTNFFRGSFANPTALGGSVALALERVDTRGPRGDEDGNRNGVWARYQLHAGDRAGLSVDFRRMSTETELDVYPSSTSRTDWGVRGRALLLPGMVGEAWWASSSYDLDEPAAEFEGIGGSRSQAGTRLVWERSGLFGRGVGTWFSGDDLPGSRLELTGGYDNPVLGGVSATWERTGWSGTSTAATRLQAWTAPFLGFSLFASRESGTRGARTGPIRSEAPGVPEPDTGDVAEPDSGVVAEPEPELADPLFRVVDRSATRYGAQWAWRGVVLSGALLEVEADSLLPTGLPFDRGEAALPGGTRSGWEAFGRLPLPLLDGLHVQGSLQQWEEAWPYLPERIYRGSFVYHRTFLESGNLELDARVGVRGRDPMTTRILGDETVDEETGETVRELLTVPFYQSWYGRIQVRVVTVRVFISWENAAVRRNLQDVPGRVLPRTRASYGIRWTLWN